MAHRSTFLFALLALIATNAANAAPLAVQMSLSIGAPTALGGFLAPQTNFTADVSNVQVDGGFTLSNIQATMPATTFPPNLFGLSIDNSYFLIQGAFALNGGTFGPGSGGFGGSAPIVDLSANQRVHDIFLGRNLLVNTGWLGPIFGADGAVRAFAGAGTTHISGTAGRWTTATVTLAGTHDVLGAFSTQVAGSDQRNAFGVGTLSMVSPVFLEWQNGCCPPTPGSDFALFAALELTFVPEPVALALMSVGFVGLVALRRTR